MSLQNLERKPILALPEPATSDSLYFDLAHYRSKMTRYLDEAKEEHRIFYDALEFSYTLHAGQRRKSGAPYISHPCAVAEIIARELRFTDPVLLSAALLHDLVEDVPSITLEDIEERFGKDVAELVDGCTKLTRHHLDRATLKDLTHSKIFLSASRRLGVIIIKLADRLHNLRTLYYLPQSKRQRIAQETVEVYAPIAARLNMFTIKRELYHLALTNLYPRKSKKVLQFIRDLRNSPAVAEIEGKLQQAFSQAPYPVLVRSRTKGLGSYYDPLKRTLDITNPENYVDFAIILQTDDVLDCYSAMGIVNTTFTPLPRSLRDFIATPKSNGYRSLHTRIHISGQNYLVKIRSANMDDWASYGILGQWETQQPLSDEHWQEVSELLRTIGEYGGAGPQRKALIRLSESEEIFAYTPKGDVYYLPKGSLVLDFAYRIHSELGDYCEGAMVNGEWTPPTRMLKDGDTVEILTSPEPLDVEPELEELCKTPKARMAINKHLQQKRWRYAQDLGRQILLQEIHRHGLPEDLLESESTRLFLELYNLKGLPDLFLRLGQDTLSPHLVLYYMEAPQKDRVQGAGSLALPYEHNTVRITELDQAVHKFARCCNPYPGQTESVATLSERGTTFHHRDCPDLHQRHALQPQQLLGVEWDMQAQWRHALVFQIHVLDETPTPLIPLLSQLPLSIHLQKIESLSDRYDQPIVGMGVRLRNFDEAQRFFSCLSKHRITIEDYGREGGSRRSSPAA